MSPSIRTKNSSHVSTMAYSIQGADDIVSNLSTNMKETNKE